jgi:PAS domain S-box-containing protein
MSLTTPPPHPDAAAAPAAGASRGRELPLPGWMWLAVFGGLTVGILAVGTFLLRRQFQANHRASQAELTAIADLKVGQIQRWYQDRLDDAGHLQDAGAFATLVREHLAVPSAAATQARVHRWLESLARHHGYRRAVLFDGQLRVHHMVPDGEATVDDQVTQAARAVLQSGRLQMVDLYRSGGSGEIFMGLLVPIMEPGQAPLGVVWLEIQPEAYLYPRLRAWPTASATGETTLVRREGDEVIFLNQVRHTQDTALRQRLPLSRRDVPAVRAALGEEGVAEGVDYRGVPVLAVVRRVAGTPWSIVAKIDRGELDAPAQEQTKLLLAAAGALVLAAGLGVGGAWRAQQARFELRESAQRDRIAEARRENEALLNEMGRIAKVGGWEIDLRTGALQWTREVHAIHEVAADYVPQLATAIEFYAPECQPLIRAAVERAIGHGEPFDLELELITAQGRRVWVQARGHALRVGGEATKVAGTFQDISARKAAALERERLFRELERKNEDLESLLYVASHDLRAPLVNVQGFGERLEKLYTGLSGSLPPDVSERMAKALRHIRAGAGKMDRLISGLLRVSRVGQGGMVERRQEPEGLVRHALAALELQIQQSGAVVDVGPLPPCWGDALLLEQVFANLVDNAIKYRAPDRPLRVTITGQVEGAEVVYCVADTGRGIAASHQDQIWEMFHRLYPEGPVPGEGLGLSIVRRIVVRHRGRVWVQSAVNVGSSFFFALPVAAAGAPTPKEGA